MDCPFHAATSTNRDDYFELLIPVVVEYLSRRLRLTLRSMAMLLDTLQRSSAGDIIDVIAGETFERVVLTVCEDISPRILRDYGSELPTHLSYLRIEDEEEGAEQSGQQSEREEAANRLSQEADAYAEQMELLQCTFYLILQDVDNCLVAVQIHAGDSEGFDALLTKVAADNMYWDCLLSSVKGLYHISLLNEQCTENLSRMLRARAAALDWLIRKSSLQDDHFWLGDYKALLKFESRRRLALRMLPDLQTANGNGKKEFMVSRSEAFSESFRVVAFTDPRDLQSGISVKFLSEEAAGPGVVREWFRLICREVFCPEKDLFISCPHDQRRVFPNFGSSIELQPYRLLHFRFCGRIVALALMHRVQLNVLFSVPFFKQIAGLPVSWQDVRDVDPQIYESCKKILEMDHEEINSGILQLAFTEEENVNSDNRCAYVEQWISERFITRVQCETICFACGFSELMEYGDIQQFLKRLYPDDLDLILYGKDEDICVEDWVAHTVYHGYNQWDNQITWFWKVLREMTNTQRRKMLAFCTSITHLPPKALEASHLNSIFRRVILI